MPYIAVEGSRILTGFQVGDHGEDMEIPHLLFANETILLCGASSEILRAIRCVQLCFEVAFRMRVNLGKVNYYLWPSGRGGRTF